VLSQIPEGRSGGDFEGKMDFAAVIFDEKNTIVRGMQETLNLSHDPELPATAYFTAEVEPGSYLCRVVFRDANTGRSAVASGRVMIPESGIQEIKASAPLYLVPGESGQYFQFALEKSEKPESKNFSLKDIYPFLSSSHVPLLDKLERDVSTLLSLVRVESDGAGELNIDITSAMKNEKTGESFPLKTVIISVEEKNGAGVAFLEVGLPELESGEYTLTMFLEDKDTGNRRSFEKKITIG
ncbi:MAG: hypothetical protein JXB26_03660, partial [Candidatus Aminicenantes bacterium]|nr:hypothetical protein [Candidatus Aminicenantes bacterium]